MRESEKKKLDVLPAWAKQADISGSRLTAGADRRSRACLPAEYGCGTSAAQNRGFGALQLHSKDNQKE